MTAEPGAVLALEVRRVVAHGDGLAELDGLKVFIPMSAPEERVRARIITRKRDYAVARIEEILEPSPLRVQPRCPLYGDCGGCHLQHLSHPGQLIVKKLIVNDALQHVGRIFLPVRNIAPGPDPWRYRNKTQYPVADQDGLRVGFFQRASHRLLNIPSCLLHPEEVDQMRSAALEGIMMAGETAYDERRHRGNIRHLVFRRSRDTGQMLAVIVTRTGSVGSALVERLAAEAGVVGVIHNVQSQQGNRILGRDFALLSGQGYLIETVLGRAFRVSAGSFFQVNVPQAEDLVRKVLRLLEPSGAETALDLYSGVGMLALLVAPFVKSVTGIEVNRTAVEDAEFNAGALDCSNVRFICGDVEKELDNLPAADAVIVDPPRRGCSDQTVNNICRLRPHNIIYVSCNPATLARDLRTFETLGYVTRDVEPLDMFPQTFHVEVVARLSPR